MRSYFTLAVVTPPETVVYQANFGVMVFARHVRGEVARLGGLGRLRPGQSYLATVIPGYGQPPDPVVEASSSGPHPRGGYHYVGLRAEIEADQPERPMTYFTVRLTLRSPEAELSPIYEQHYPLSAIAYWTEAVLKGLRECSVLPERSPHELRCYARYGEVENFHQEFARVADGEGREVAVALAPGPERARETVTRRPGGAELIGESGPEGPLVYISRQAAARIQEQAREDTTRETGGLLVGRAGVDECQRAVVDISGTLPAQGAVSDAVSVRFTAEVWQGMIRQHAESPPEQQIVGWYHSHVMRASAGDDSPVEEALFMSAQDRTVHRHFREPTDVALVVEAGGGGLAFFHWNEGRIGRCGGYYLYDDQSAESGLAGD